MQISLTVVFDESRLRRDTRFVMRDAIRATWITGGSIVALGVLVAIVEQRPALGPGLIVGGLVYAALAGPMAVRRAVRAQTTVVGHDRRLLLTDDWITLVYPLVESRWRWAAVARVVDAEDTIYLMVGSMQSIPIPKAALGPAQHSELTAFLAART